ncbi:MAG: glycosyltransferase [bacterium]|nr:glycosyltransferase [bacterium]
MPGSSRHRIAYVIGELGKGGAEYQLYELLRGLDRARFEPAVFALAAGGYWAGPLRELGVPVHELAARGSADAGRLLRLRRALRAFAPRLLHTVLWSGNSYGRLAATGLGIPIVLTAERNVIARPGWQIAVERVLDRLTDTYLLNCRAIADGLVERQGLAADKMCVIPNGIDLARLPRFEPARAAARAAAGFAPQRRLVAQVGRLAEQKDYPTYLRAAARLAPACADVDFLVVGEGGLREELVALATSLGIAERVHFTGLRHDVPAVLAGVDVLALTSLYEGLPNVVIEAMATGAVAVATDVGGCRELVVDGETGVLVPARQPEAVADAITALLRDPGRTERLRLAARRRIEDEFSLEAMVRRTTAVYLDHLRARGFEPGAAAA